MYAITFDIIFDLGETALVECQLLSVLPACVLHKIYVSCAGHAEPGQASSCAEAAVPSDSFAEQNDSAATSSGEQAE